MSGFNFRLDSLVQIREWETQEAAREYGLAQEALKGVELRMHEKRSDYEGYSEKLLRMRQQGGDMQGQAGVFDLMKQILVDLRGMEKDLEEARVNEQEKLKEYLAIRGREQALCNYKEREKGVYMKEMERKEEQVVQDGVIMRANREF